MVLKNLERDQRVGQALIDRFALDGVTAQAASSCSKFRFWLDEERACVAYVDTGRAWVAAGRPAAVPGSYDSALRRFTREAQRHGRRARFFGVETAAANPSARTLAIGSQPTWTPKGWLATLARKKSLREQLRRARAKGVSVKVVDTSVLSSHTKLGRELESLRQGWLDQKGMSPMQFVAHTDLFDGLDRREMLVARHKDLLAGVLVATPLKASNALMFEHLFRAPSAPNGTVETLFHAGLERAEACGIERATLGLCPLAGVSSWWLRAIRRASRPLYDFDGLYGFKKKLEPDDWKPVFVTIGHGEGGAMAIVDTLSAFAGQSLFAFGWSSLRKHRRMPKRLGQRPLGPRLAAT